MSPAQQKCDAMDARVKPAHDAAQGNAVILRCSPYLAASLEGGMTSVRSSFETPRKMRGSLQDGRENAWTQTNDSTRSNAARCRYP
jgi:hypothetical protein